MTNHDQQVCEAKAASYLKDVRAVRDLMMQSSVAAVICDLERPDVPIVACNEAFENLTGYRIGEIIDRNCRILNRGRIHDASRQSFRSAIQSRTTYAHVVRNFRKDGTEFLNGVTLAPIYNAKGRAVAMLGSQIDLTNLDPTSRLRAFYHARAKMNCLSTRQQQVTIAMANGKMIKEIGHDLGIAERTVKLHRASAIEALGVTNSVQAIRIAIEAGY